MEFNFKELFRQSILLIPLVVVTYFLAESVIELDAAQEDVRVMTRQELGVLQQVRQKYQTRLLLEDDTFDRRAIISQV